MSGYIYRVASRPKGGDEPWRPVETGKRLYFEEHTARSVMGGKINEYVRSIETAERYVAAGGNAERVRKVLDAPPKEFAVQRALIGEWEAA